MDLNSTSVELGQDGMKLIREICDVAYTRLPGSENEQKAQDYMKNKFHEWGAHEITTREYGVYSRFFRYWPILSIILFYLSLISYLFFPLLAFILVVIAALNLIFKIFSYTVLDVFFKKNPSSNVIAKLKAKNAEKEKKPKRILVIGGHIDSNYEYPIGKKYGVKMIKFVIPVFLLMLIWILITLIHFIFTMQNDQPLINFTASALTAFTKLDWAFILILFTIPYISWVGFRMVSNTPVPGANDNLSGIAVAAEVLKYFASHPEDAPKNVELWLVSFGSEEGGMMGSKAMAKDVQQMIFSKNLPAESIWVINFDSIAADGPILIATKEPMYRAKHHPDVYNQLAESARKAGVEVIVKSLTAGTDSAPFSRLGIPACGMVCMGKGHNPPNWHSIDDTPENCDVKGLEHCIKLALQFIKDIDEILDKN